jgi:hypothetical protein
MNGPQSAPFAPRYLAELKRAIKPGVRLRCISNSYGPELNGRERLVARVQTNAFTWSMNVGPPAPRNTDDARNAFDKLFKKL